MNKKPLVSDIKEIFGTVKESPNSDWAKLIYRVSYNDRPAGVDIRNVKVNPDGTYNYGKGISLTNEETDAATELLVEKGFGRTEVLTEALKKRNILE